ncbi:MAG: Rnase Y domain-containing protein, partial [Lachnospiraceae bacterium]|nr:Rnase Y domain-containing protein [Lachnospiraceae bacterium]
MCAVCGLLVGAVAAWLIASKVVIARKNREDEATIGTAQSRAKEIIEEATKAGEAKKREALVEVKEESIRAKKELDKEVRARNAEVQHYEQRVLKKEENLDRKLEAAEKKEAKIAAKELELERIMSEQQEARDRQ